MERGQDGQFVERLRSDRGAVLSPFRALVDLFRERREATEAAIQRKKNRVFDEVNRVLGVQDKVILAPSEENAADSSDYLWIQRSGSVSAVSRVKMENGEMHHESWVVARSVRTERGNDLVLKNVKRAHLSKGKSGNVSYTTSTEDKAATPDELDELIELLRPGTLVEVEGEATGTLHQELLQSLPDPHEQSI